MAASRCLDAAVGHHTDPGRPPGGVGACHDAAILYGAVASASSGAPPFGTDADGLRQSVALLRDHLTGTEFRSCVDKGEQLNGSQVIDLALQAIGRAAAKA